MVLAARKWRKFLQAATKAIFITDHKPLVWMQGQKDPRGKFTRWLLELESLNYNVEFRRGENNCAADYLSRTSMEFDSQVNDEVEQFERHVYSVVRPEEEFIVKLRDQQAKDVVTSDAIGQVRAKGGVTNGQLKRYDGLVMRDGLFCRY